MKDEVREALREAQNVIGSCDCAMSEGCGDPDPRQNWREARDRVEALLEQYEVVEGALLNRVDRHDVYMLDPDVGLKDAILLVKKP